jgi:hypothetical protein
VAKPGGWIDIIDLQGDDDPEVDELNHRLEVLHDPTHGRSYTSYTVDTWMRTLEEAGLRIIAVERDVSERPGGVSVERWCEIAASGGAAMAALNPDNSRSDRGS